ncbi:MAG: BBP7 family outer membrane beta-barrel protein [Pirellulales bacterium]
MKNTYFSGLAISLAVAGAPSVAWAQQYSVPSMYGSQLAPSSYGYAPNPYQLVGAQADQLIPQQLGIQHEHVPLPPTQSMPQSMGQQPIYPMPQPTPMAQPMPQPTPMHQGSAYQGSVYQGADQTGMPMSSSMGGSCSSCNSGQASGYDYSGMSYGSSCGTGACGQGYMGGCGLPMGQRWSMGCGTGMGGCGMGCGPAMPRWFAGAGAIFMAQQDGRYVALSNVGGVTALNTQEARLGTAPGVSANIGRYFNCGRNAIVGSYWGMFGDANQAVALDTGLRSSLNFGQPQALATPGVEYFNGTTTVDVYDIYNDDVTTMVTAQRVRRDNEVHNGEINILGFGLGGAAIAPSCGCGGYFGGPSVGLMPSSCGRLRMTWLAGVRWLRFTDDFEYATSRTDDMFGNTADDFYYTNAIKNDLVGFQLGTNLNYCVGQRVSVYSGAKFGVMGNHMQYDTRLGTASTAATINSPNPAYNGQQYDFMSTRDNISFLGEGDVGLCVRICRGWSANVGYRAIGVSGIATAVGQIPYKFDDVNSITRINNNDSLLLHGVYFGGSYNF